MSPRFLKLLAISYLVKTAVVAVAWLMVPDLPQRARTAVQDGWAWVVSSSAQPD